MLDNVDNSLEHITLLVGSYKMNCKDVNSINATYERMEEGEINEPVLISFDGRTVLSVPREVAKQMLDIAAKHVEHKAERLNTIINAVSNTIAEVELPQ